MSALLEVSGLHRSFGGVQAVDGVDFRVEEGEAVGLIGPNGAGKTTVFNVVAGALRPDAGRIVFRGVDTTRLRAYEVARLGLVRSFQLPRVFGRMTVLENMLLASADRRDAGLAPALLRPLGVRRRERALAAEAVEHLRRFGLDAFAQQPARVLSGGQKKLLGLAMALMAKSALLLLDEPAAGVNPSLANEIADFLVELRQEGLTLFVIEHNLGFLERVADRVLVMAEGRVLTEGSLAELRADTAVLDAYLGSVDRGAHEGHANHDERTDQHEQTSEIVGK